MNFCESTKLHLLKSIKQLLQNFPWFVSPTSVPLFKLTLTSSYPTLSRGMVFWWLHSSLTSYQSPAWSNLLPSNLGLKMTSSSHDSVCWLYSWSYFHAKPLACILFFCSQSIIISLEKLSSVSTNFSRDISMYGIWMTSICTYLIPVSCPIQCTPLQPWVEHDIIQPWFSLLIVFLKLLPR